MLGGHQAGLGGLVRGVLIDGEDLRVERHVVGGDGRQAHQLRNNGVVRLLSHHLSRRA
jgi:hypothetical protein